MHKIPVIVSNTSLKQVLGFAANPTPLATIHTRMERSAVLSQTTFLLASTTCQS